MQPSVPGVLQANSYDYNLQAPSGSTGSGPAAAPASPLVQGTGQTSPLLGAVDTGVTTTYDPAAAAAAQKAAEDAARAAALRGEVVNLVNQFKSILDTRYGQVDRAAGEQVGKLNERFGTESSDITSQVGKENESLGAAYSGRGAYDSSYRSNSQDTVTEAGKGQIRDLGTELADNVNKIGGWVANEKAGFDAEKGSMDSIVSRLAEETSPDSLVTLRNQIDAKIATLRAGDASNNTATQNAAALASIAPSSARTVQLKTTLSQIVAGNADPGQKAAIGQALINNAGLAPEEAQKLLVAFQSDLSAPEKQEQTV